MSRGSVVLFAMMGAAALLVIPYVNKQLRPVVAVLDQPVQPVDPATGKPAGKLVVLVVFDQMRGDYLAKWAEHFGPDGFERLKKDGVWYSDVHIPYACTSTGPGHASLLSGAPPAVNGIIENDWWDRRAAKRVYCCQPSRPFELVPPLPADAGGAARGADTGFSPERLLAETVGDKLKAADGGKGRVVSLSIKDRTAVLMGGSKPDAAYCFDVRDGLFHTGTYYRDQPHAWVTEFNAAKPAEKWFDQQWDRVRPDLDYAKVTGNPDDAPGESTGANKQGRVFPHPYKGQLAAPAPAYFGAVECSPAGNELLLEFTKKAVVAEKLGQGDTRDLLCLSFSSNDIIGHAFGPDSWEVFDVTLRTDKLVADLLAFLDATVGKGKYTLVLSADHGVSPVPEQKKLDTAQRVRVTDVYEGLGAALAAAFEKTPGGPTQWFETTDPKDMDRIWPWVYLNDAAITARGLKPEDVAATARDWLAKQGYIETAFTSKQLETEAFPDGSFGAKAKLAFRADRCGDVLAVPQPGVQITNYTAGSNHGSPQPYDTHVPVLAIGAGVPALGKQADRKSSLVVAPMLAKGLGIDAPAKAVENAPY